MRGIVKVAGAGHWLVADGYRHYVLLGWSFWGCTAGGALVVTVRLLVCGLRIDVFRM